MEKKEKKLSNLSINTFGFGDGGFQFIVNLELFYFSLFLTDYCKFAPALAGIILTVTSIVDCVWVPTAGAIVEKANFKWMKWGKYRSWLLVGPPITYLLFIPMFLYIPGPLAPYIISFGFIASHLVWNVVYTAHLSLISVMTDDPYERTRLSTSRQICSTVAKIIFGYIVLATIIKMGTAVGNPAMGFTFGAMLFPLLMIAGYYVVFFSTKGYDSLPPVLTGTTEKAKKEKVPVSMLLKETFKNSQLMILMSADFFRCFAYYLVTSTAIYFFRKIYGDMSNWAFYLVV
ncbi:MAG: MFS transporter, partial [Oscillospiraceae bacterium]